MKPSKRIKKLQQELIKTIPKFPNNKDTKSELENTDLTSLMIHYLNWAIRYVSAKKRSVVIEPEVTNDRRWSTAKNGINLLLEKVKNGEDLTPHLSLKTHKRGYSSSASMNQPNADRWEDKDFLLNTMGYHHFHLGVTMEQGGVISRTDEVLFARVTRELFSAVAIFDHSVFEFSQNNMTAERDRLWEIFDRHVASGAPKGTVILSSVIATSGHPMHIVGLAQDYAWVISQTDPKLEEYEFLKKLYVDAGLNFPKRPKLEWRLNYSDLCLYEKNYDTLLILRRGVN